MPINIDIICLNEHNISQEHKYVLNKFTNYKYADGFFRNVSRGGSCILVRNSMKIKNRPDLVFLNEQLTFEGSVIEIEQMGCIIISIYRTPGHTITNIFLSKLKQLLQKLEYESKNKKVIIAADININLLANDFPKIAFVEIVKYHGFSINNKEPSRVTKSSATCIDNILTSKNYGVRYFYNFDPSLSDHNAIIISLPKDRKNIKKNFKKQIRVFDENNMIGFVNKLALELQTLAMCHQLDTNYKNFLQKLIMSMNEFFPVKQVNIKQNSKKLNWITKGILVSAAKKRQLHKESKKSNDVHFINYVKLYKKIFKKVVSKAKKMANDNYICNSKNKSKATWTVVKKELGLESKKPHNIVLEYNDEEIVDPKHVAQCFNTHYCSIVDNLNIPKVSLNDHPNYSNRLDIPILSSFFPTTPDEIRKIILGLNNTFSTGWDEVPVLLLKKANDIICPVIANLVNQAFDSGQFPKSLKLSEIIPVHKKGSTKDLSNYRPVALLSNISKIFEKAMQTRISSFFQIYNRICKEQFGYCKNKNTELALIAFVNSTLEALDRSQLTAGVFCDLSKAFDCVDHKLLIQKMSNIGIKDKALKLMVSYLEDRLQRTVINKDSNKFFSNWDKVTYGVPQGSVLGPTLFLIYINNLPSEIDKQFVLFADDTSVLIREKSVQELNVSISNTLAELNLWFKLNGLLLNEAKTNVMHFNPKKLNGNNQCSGDTTLKHSEFHKFLGVTIDQNLNWKNHVQTLISKTNTFRYAFRILINTVSIETCKVVYFSYIESVLKYGIIVWGNSSDFNKLFISQKNIIRTISRVDSKFSCRPLFRNLNILTLPCLYIFEVLKWVHKNPNDFDKFKSNHIYNTRNKDLFSFPNHRLTKFERSPLYMGIKLYNKLTNEIKSLNDSQFYMYIKKRLINKAYYSVKEMLDDSYFTS